MKILHLADAHLDSKMESKLDKSKAAARRDEMIDTFCSIADISFRMKKTKADPSAVPAKGISRPIKIASILRSFTVQR